MERREARERRILAHARRGYRMARQDPDYALAVSRRLAPALEQEASSLWEAIDWTWAVALGVIPAQGPLSTAIEGGAEILRLLMEGDDSAASRWPERTGDRLSLTSTLQSHPFADQSSWFIRKTCLAS